LSGPGDERFSGQTHQPGPAAQLFAAPLPASIARFWVKKMVNLVVDQFFSKY